MTAVAPFPSASSPDAILEAVGAAAHRFLTLSSPWEESALEVLEGLGRAAGASRAYLFENYPADSGLRTRQRFQWTAPDAPSQEGIDLAADFAFAEIGLERWEGILSRGGTVHGRTGDLPASEQGELRIEGILAIAIVPVFVNGTWWGFVGFDECRAERPWTPAELESLRTAAGMFAAVIASQHNSQRLQQRVAALARIAAALSAEGSLEAKLRILAQSVVEATAAAACSVVLIETDPLQLVTSESWGLPAGYAEAYRAVWATKRPEDAEGVVRSEPLLIESLAEELALDERYAPLADVLGDDLSGALVAVPLIAGATQVGMCHAFYRRPGPVHPDERAFLNAIADHGAVAVEHARLLEEAAHTTLLEERQRLSRELHDSVSQAVYGIALGARTARALLDIDPARVVEPLDYVLQLAEAGLAEMRALIFELRPESLEREGLVAALEKQAQSVQARHEVVVRTRLGPEPDMPLNRKEAVYRIGQEALHNVVKHARASVVDLEMSCADGHLSLVITDDGIGFDACGDYPGHLGLHTMRERAETIGGSVEVRSAPGEGSIVRLSLPLA